MEEAKWRIALNKFLEQWLERQEVVGALVTGSYVLGTSNPNSDIDVHVFLAAETEWKERGNIKIDGYLIEYFALPINLYHKLFDMDHADNQRTNARMISVGEIVSGKTGEVANIKNLSDEYMSKPFKQLTTPQIEDRKYWLWDSMDGLDDLLLSNALNSEMVYYSHIILVLNVYTVYLRQEIPHLGKVLKLFTSAEFRERYHFDTYPDKVFSDMFVVALSAPHGQRLAVSHNLTNHVLSAMGNFTIDGWQLRSRGNMIDV